MRIELSTLKLLYGQVCCVVGQWAQHSIIWINRILSYVQNSPTSYLSLIGANIILFEIAIFICRIANNLLNRWQNYNTLQEYEQSRRSLGLSMLIFSVLVVGNYAFYHAFRLPLSRWKVITLSLTTNFVYLYCKA